MISRRSILAISIGLGLALTGLACGWDEEPFAHDLFTFTPEIPYLDQQRQNESVAFWSEYLGRPEVPDMTLESSISYMSKWHFESEGSNELIDELNKRGDATAIAFLKLNVELNELVHAHEGWDYRIVSAQEYLDLLNRIDQLKITGPLNRRKTFLKVRTLFAVKDYVSIQRLWDSFISKWEPCPLRDRIEGYLTAIKYKKGQYNEAIDYYLRTGDGESIQLCVNRLLESTSIEQQYAQDPNAPILPYILQDYANYLHHANCDEYWTQGDDGYKIWTTVTRERDKVLALAHRVVSEGKTKDPQMWQSFVGFLQMMSGQNDQAYQSFCQAEKMKGNTTLGKTLRLHKLCAALGMDNKPDGLDRTLVDELVHYSQSDYNGSDIEYQVSYAYYHDLLHARLTQYLNQKADPTLSYLCMLAVDSYNVWKLDTDEYSIAQIKDLYNVVASNGGGNALYSKLINATHLSQDRVAEFLGTRLLRQGEFAEAADYFRKVSLDYISQQGITPYLMLRPMVSSPFNRITYNELDGEEFGTATNRKLEFCELAEQYRQTFTTARDKEERAQAGCNLARLLFHGSAAGDLWAISQYSHSSYEHYNELDSIAVGYLQQAVRLTSDPQLADLCYFGLAAIPDSHDVVYYRWDEDRQAPYLLTPTKRQFDAYERIRTHRCKEPLYDGCDWLGLYARMASND